MKGFRKIFLFYLLLIVNHILHTYEIYTQGYLLDKNLLIKNSTWFLALQFFFLIILVSICYPLLKGNKWAMSIIRIVAFIFLLYGSVLAFGNIYNEEKVAGSLTGYFFVMISLPLILWISDYFKKFNESNKIIE